MRCNVAQLKTARFLFGYYLLRNILSVTMVITCMFGCGSSQLDGSIPACMEEGSEVYVPGISDDPCISCICRDQQIRCMKQQCADIEGCHQLLFSYEQISCCETCRGCFFEGRDIASGTTWVDQDDSCRSFLCQAGVVTESQTKCQVTCSNPQYIPGQCCPICPGCYSSGRLYRNGETFPAPEDTCSTCVCSNGSVSCKKAACPVLNCIEEYIDIDPGACCPKCRGTRQIYDLQKRACLFKNMVVANDKITQPDACTDCVCLEGTMVCKRKTCPPITCPKKYYVIYDNTTCCPRCERPARNCRYKMKKFENGQLWNPDGCTECLCTDGVVHCKVHQCDNDVLQCPQNTHMQHVPGKCCPECVDDVAVCTVFGDPHYRTFDGNIYNFQGLCNYILARDCSSRDFSIHVRNDARSTNDFAWTKSVTIRLRKVKVYLFRNFRVKIDRKRVKIPFDGYGIKITGGSHTMTLKTYEGVKIIWDGDSYLEVSVPPKYKNNMCGLCGNYNNDAHDDLTGRDGVKYFNPANFGETWRIGQKTLCLHRSITSQSELKGSCTNKSEKREARKKCEVLKTGIHGLCTNAVQSQPYYESCVADVCDCPDGKDCACEAVLAYVRECQRHNVNIEWSQELCRGEFCELDKQWSECADPCPYTCNNRRSNSDKSCSKLCQPGCECKPGLVLHEKECIEPKMCPSYTKRKKKKRKKETRLNTSKYQPLQEVSMLDSSGGLIPINYNPALSSNQNTKKRITSESLTQSRNPLTELLQRYNERLASSSHSRRRSNNEETNSPHQQQIIHNANIPQTVRNSGDEHNTSSDVELSRGIFYMLDD